MKEKEQIEVAKNIALTSTYINSQEKLIRVGAVIFTKRGKMIASSVNQKKTHHLQDYYNSVMPYKRIPYLHAEIAALLKARWAVGKEGLRGCHVVVARALNCGGWGLARPCAACRAAMRDMGIKEVIYTTEKDGFAKEYL